jgi:hypothetical protein
MIGNKVVSVLQANKQGTVAACLFLDTAMVARYDLHPGSAIQLL